MLLDWGDKAWLESSTHGARLYMLNSASNAVNLSPSWAASFDSVIWFRGFYLGGLCIFFGCSESGCIGQGSLTNHTCETDFKLFWGAVPGIF